MPISKSHPQVERILIETFSGEFARLHSGWCSLVDSCAAELFYQPSGRSDGVPLPSVGEILLRSAAVVEQSCGGITSNLWDDPFEWTLPETLSTRERIIEYLAEVEATRRLAFDSFASDADLSKEISRPSGEVQTLASLLMQTLARASEFQGQAVLTAKMLFAGNTSRFII